LHKAKAYFLLALLLIGAFYSGLVWHEAYHLLTAREPYAMCLAGGNGEIPDSIAEVELPTVGAFVLAAGQGSTSETIAYAIQGAVSIATFVIGLFAFRKELKSIVGK